MATTPTSTPAASTATPGTTVGTSSTASTSTSTTAAGGKYASIPGFNSVVSSTAASGARIQVSALTPAAFKQAHCSRPIIVVFYQPGSVVDEHFLDDVRAVAAAVKDEELLLYTPKDVRTAGDLPVKLGLLATPGVAVVARDGTLENFWTSYIDRGLLQSSVNNAIAAKPCRVSSSDVPSVGSGLADAAAAALS